MTHKHIFAVSLLALSPLAAVAGQVDVTVPFKTGEIFDEIDKHQLAYTTVTLSADGKGQVHTKFSNGKQVDGDLFVTYTQLTDKDGNLLALIRLAKGLNGSYGGKAREGSTSAPVMLQPEFAKRVVRINVVAKTEDRCGDEKFWSGAAKQAVLTAVKSYVTGTPPSIPQELAKLQAELRAACDKAPAAKGSIVNPTKPRPS